MEAKIFGFGDYRLDRERFELKRGEYRVKLERKPMELLMLLVAKNGGLLTREEIAAALWDPAVFVDVNASINTLVRKVRYALRDEAESPRFVETVPGKGYRFVSGIVKEPEREENIAAATAVAEVQPATTLEPSFPAGMTLPGNGKRKRPLLWLGIACAAVAALGALLFARLQKRPYHAEYSQLTNFADSASAPSLSPDGRMLVFMRGSDAFLSPNQIYIKMLPNGEAKRLTDDKRWKYRPVFSPDGSEVAYTVVDGTRFDTVAVPVLGGEARPLLENAAGLSWLRNDEVLFSRVHSGLHMGVIAGNLPQRQFHDVYFPAREREMAHYSFPSPDRSVAVVVQMAENGGWTQCRLISLEGRFQPRFVGPEDACNAAAWSPDGRWIYFTAARHGKSNVWRQSYPGGTPEQVTFGPAEEEGLAMEPDGRSAITSFGVRQSSLWWHEPKGDRALVMEGDISGSGIEEAWEEGPVISPDNEYVYYLLRPHSGSAAEFTRVDLKTGHAQSLFPGVAMHDFDLSADGRQILYSCDSAQGEASLCIASLDHASPPRRIAISEVTHPRFGAAGKLYFERKEGGSRFVEEMNEDGSDRHKVLPEPVFDNVLLSPARHWLMTAFTPGPLQFRFRAISLRGEASRTYCSTPCWPYWSPDGKWLYIAVEDPVGSNPGRALAIPVGPGERLPEFPPGGIQAGTPASAIPGSVVINRAYVIPGVDPEHYAYLAVTTQRNLYRMTLP